MIRTRVVTRNRNAKGATDEFGVGGENVRQIVVLKKFGIES